MPYNGSEEEMPFQLLVDTVNGGGLGPMKKYLAQTKAHVVLAQEPWIRDAEMAEVKE